MHMRCIANSCGNTHGKAVECLLGQHAGCALVSPAAVSLFVQGAQLCQRQLGRQCDNLQPAAQQLPQLPAQHAHKHKRSSVSHQRILLRQQRRRYRRLYQQVGVCYAPRIRFQRYLRSRFLVPLRLGDVQLWRQLVGVHGVRLWFDHGSSWRGGALY